MNRAPAWLRIRLGAQSHALDAQGLRQILPRPRILPLPQATPACPGVVAWQGRPLLVVDLGSCLLRRPSLERPDARLVVWGGAAEAGAFAVDAVGDLLRLTPARLERHWAPALPGLPPPWNAIQGLIHGADGAPGRAAPLAVFDAATLWRTCWRQIGISQSDIGR